MRTMRILNRNLALSLTVLTALALHSRVCAAESSQSMYKPPFAAPGGLSPIPQMFPPVETPDGVQLEWRGLTPPYQVQGAGDAGNPVWVDIGSPTSEERQTVPTDEAMSLFRIRAAEPTYLGQNVCAFCHQGVHDEWADSPHPHALEPLQEVGQADNPTCLPCHTLGYGYASGFQSLESTPEKGSVQCENCHGPAGQHVSNISDPSRRPKITLASANCGGCHNYEFVHRTYDEWMLSKHTEVTPVVANRFESQGESAMNECGACHSSAVRLALLDQWERAQDDPGAEAHLPSREDAAYFAVDCVTCHKVHAVPNPPGVRNPLFSLEDFSYDTHTPFAEQYNPDLHLCAQCHNQRGADWRSTSRPPHRSPQYNVLIGTAGYDPDQTGLRRTHATLEDQCVFCHSAGYGSGPLAKGTHYMGHSTGVDYEKCSECHGSAEIGELLRDGTRLVTEQRIQEVRGLLDFWGENQAPFAIRDKYGRLAWEYTHVGELSNPTNDPELTGPSSDEQALIPDAIKQARLNLYLVYRDGSFGVHNGAYVRHLLEVAKANVQAELAKP